MRLITRDYGMYFVAFELHKNLHDIWLIICTSLVPRPVLFSVA